MSKRELIATKALTYGTRRMKAEEPFTARTTGDATLLVALGRARPAKGVVVVKAPRAAPKAKLKPKAPAKARRATKTKTA